MTSTLAYALPFTPYPYVGEKTECDLCGSRETVLICEYDRRFKRLTTVACRRCGLMRTDPMPTLAEVGEYYRSAYRRDYQRSTGPSRRHLYRARREAEWRLGVLEPALRPGARMLDFGSGAGVFLGAAKAAGYSIMGIEPGSDYAGYARATFGVEVINDIWENIDQPLGPFDVITAIEVLEHLRKPVTALRWLASHLADDGVMYITVPNTLPDGRETFRRFHFAHLHNFVPATLLWAAEACGLECDPRLFSSGTALGLRKSARGPVQPKLDRNYGEGLESLYPHASIARYVLTGRWFARSLRQIRKTVRDTRAMPP